MFRAILVATTAATAAHANTWSFAGPATYATRGGDPLHPPLTAAGAAQNIAKGANGSSWFMGSVNGGLWRTTTFGDVLPTWDNVLDNQPVTCSSIAALHVSLDNPSRMYAGCGGSTSSMNGRDYNVMNSGDWSGVMSSQDGGTSWTMTSFPINYYVTDIIETDGGLLVSAQSNLFDKNDGGLWLRSSPSAPFQRVSTKPTFSLNRYGGAIVATHPRDSLHSVSVSHDGGNTWVDGGVLPWKEKAVPFYTCATVLGNGQIVVAGLTRSPGLPNATDSQFFVASTPRGTWLELNQPTSMDEDAMPKDRMAMLSDPNEKNLMYIAGNAGALAYRVRISCSGASCTGAWVQMWDKPDVLDGSVPHGDCRNYAWDSDNGGRLILVSDGGVFGRTTPSKAGGKWVSLNGNYASMELLSAHYAPRERRFVAGAQDNCAQVTKEHALPSDVAVGFVEGDGTVTLIDNVANPARLYGTTQFLGVGTVFIDPSSSSSSSADDNDGDDDDDCGGLCFSQGDDFIGVPLDKYFPRPSSFPFFVSPYALNAQDPSKLVFWANGTAQGLEGYTKSGFYVFSIPHGTVQSKDDIPPPSLLEPTADANDFVLDFVSGGYTNDQPDPSLIVAMSNTNLYVKSAATQGQLIKRALPVDFAVPVVLEYDEANDGARILGPVTHGRTVSMSVSPSDSSLVAVTGWQTVETNKGNEEIYLTTDAGNAWVNITGNLKQATGVVGTVRPGGLLIVDLIQNNDTAVLVGTSNGVMVTYLNGLKGLKGAQWSRFGTLNEFPRVLTAAISYEHYSDTIVAATFGRGIYTIQNAKESLLDHRDRVTTIKNATKRVPEESSARYFPKQL
jgi:hypothetical protein